MISAMITHAPGTVTPAAGLLIVAALLPLPVTGQQGVQGLLQEGRVLASPETGVTFTIPSGFAGSWEPDAGGFVFQSQAPAFGSVWAWSEGTVDEVVTEVGTVLSEFGVELTPRGEPVTTATSIRGTFNALTQEGAGVLVAVVERGTPGGIVAVAAMGSLTTEAELNRFVDDVLTSLHWSTPGAAQWRSRLEGSVMRWSSSDSNMSTGGGATATGASQSVASLAFCYGEYRYTESSESYFSIEGVSASNNSSDEHSGEWALVSDFVGNPILYLDSSDGRSFAWTVVEDDEGLTVDGYLYRPAGGCQ
jgi:hypothetical protein